MLRRRINKKQIILQGISISKGIAIGKPFFLFQKKNVPNQTLSEQEVLEEIERYRGALKKSKEDLKYLQRRFIKDGAFVVADILDAHLEILQDPVITELVEKNIRKTHKNTEVVFQQVIGEYKLSIKDKFFKERIKDITDVSWRVFSHLNPIKESLEVEKNCIIIANEINPSDVFEIKNKIVSAFITDKVGYSSHVGIIARAKGIPFIAKIDINLLNNVEIENLIVDGISGIVIINPTLKNLEKYKKLKINFFKFYVELKKQIDFLTKTKDGKDIKIFSTIESLKDVDFVFKYKTEGIGLFRSEYLFFQDRKIPSEKKQFYVYKEIAKKLKNKPFIIRLFDFGGDKDFLFKEKKDFFEINPMLGCRGIRYLIKNEDLLKIQLKAILKASIHGNIKILIPFVSNLSEISFVKDKIKEVMSELKDANIPCKKVLIGMMMEVPSAAIISNIFIKEVDFCSVGTNDLMQYIMAADRANNDVNVFFDSLDYSILKLLKEIVDNSNFYGKPLILCGEMMLNPKFIELLIGLGIRNISLSARQMLEIKYLIMKINASLAEKKVKKILTFLN